MLALVLLVSAGCSSPTPTAVSAHLFVTRATQTPSSPDIEITTTPAKQDPVPNTQPPLATPSSTLAPTRTKAATPAPTFSPTPAPPRVTLSDDGRYAFPVAGDLSLMTWTHFHWDGGNAVDIEAARDLSADSEEFLTFIQLPVVAVTTATVSIADNLYGGLALLLEDVDGNSYYYGHLSEQWVADGAQVGPGDGLGRIGNSGHNSQYIEPHLHFSISTQAAGDWRWEPNVNAAEQIASWLGLPWQDLNIAAYPLDRVKGSPFAVPIEITRPFSEPLEQNPDHGSIDLLPVSIGSEPLPIFATLGGEVNVNRATAMGLRAQITNRPARTTVVYSFLQETTVADGDVVERGDLIGYVNPRVGLNYMLFVKDVPTDPVPTLDDAP